MSVQVVGIIGLGTMGKAIADGLRLASPEISILATRRRHEGSDRDSPGTLELLDSNRELAARSDVVVLAVKPHQARAVIEPIADALVGKVIISICAAIESSDIAAWAPNCAVVRVMPNTPCLIGKGMTVIARSPHATAEAILVAERLFAPLGKTAVVDESLMDAVTGLSGCGPAYVFLMIEALGEAGVKLGIDRKTSTLLAAQTLMGASEMVLLRGEHPAKLKDEVTTPAGCTVDALMALEDGRLRSTLIRGVVAAAERSRTLRQ